MERLSERVKMDIGIIPQTASSQKIGAYYKMDLYRAAVIALTVAGTIAKGSTIDLQVKQAQDANATNAKDLQNLDEDAAVSATITACEDANEATLTVDTASTGDSVTINGVTFTSASAEDASANEFDGSGTAGEEASSLASVVNATFDTIEASVSSATVTFTAVEPGTETITITDIASNFTVNMTEAQAYVDVDVNCLDVENGFTHIAADVTPSVSAEISAEVLRYKPRYTPEQQVGAYQIE